jgi:predicted ATPase
MPSSPKQCITCRGVNSKTFLWRDDRGQVVTYDCNCIEQWVLNRYLTYNGIPLNYQQIGWPLLGPQVDSSAVKRLKAYIDSDNLAYNVRTGRGLYVHGPMGVGKTTMCILVLKRLLAEGYSGHFTTFLELKDAYMDKWKDEEKRAWYDQKIRNSQVLVIDDIGRERDFAPEIFLDALESLMRYRTGALLPTIITTNQTPDEFRTKYRAHVASLLSERTDEVAVYGADWRPKMLSEGAQEREQHLTRPICIA